MENIKGIVFNIQKFSINDGPGIRTTVFLKGCPLNCIWCHNPESKSPLAEILYDGEKCVHCGKCAAVCPMQCHRMENGTHIFERARCIGCGLCAERCYTALELVGTEMTSGDVISEVLKDKVFYDNSGGGMTLSGGEPLFQFEFALELLEQAKKQGLHTCLETCGFAKPEEIKAVLPYVDLFLYDYKETDPMRHQEFTGADNKLILNNLHMIDRLGGKIILRCPLIPGFNDRPDHLEGIAQMANSLDNIIEINVEPYHPLGEGKSKKLGKDYALLGTSFTEKETVAEWIAKIQSHTSVKVKQA